jgi:conjugative relaxase-like TrwC/TraI family protein
VTPEIFQTLLEGRDLEGNTLVRAAQNGTHRVGWDLHFAPSKSISLIWAFGTEAQRTHMLESHHKAVESVMDYVERNLIEARGRVEGSTRRMPTGNMIAARFDHFTSRELDPQLHSHVVVVNMTQRKDKKWRAVANEKFFARELLTALYENELASELKERGYIVTMEKYDTGNSRYARIEGIDEKVINHFGKRQDQIEAVMDKMKERYPHATRGELRQMACLDTRQPKKSIDREVLHESWVSAIPGKVSLTFSDSPRNQKEPSPISAPSRWPLPPSTSRSQPSPGRT